MMSQPTALPTDDVTEIPEWILNRDAMIGDTLLLGRVPFSRRLNEGISSLRALEASFRAFESHRQLILDRKKNDRQEPDHDLRPEKPFAN